MSKRALNALNGSIAKWKAIVGGAGTDQGPDNCPLCKLYHDNGCTNCPVSKIVLDDFCRRTSYIDWYRHHVNNHPYDGYGCIPHLDCPDCLRLAQAELDFLKSLLPQETAP